MALCPTKGALKKRGNPLCWRSSAGTKSKAGAAARPGGGRMNVGNLRTRGGPASSASSDDSVPLLRAEAGNAGQADVLPPPEAAGASAGGVTGAEWAAALPPFLFPALGGALFGYDIGATSGAIVGLKDAALSGTDWGPALTALQSGLVVSGSLAGALGASAVALVYGDKIGRRRELQLASALYFAGSLAMWGAPGLNALLAGRLLYGLGIGFAMHGAPIYIAETAPSSVRGTLISLKEGFIVGGILSGYLAGAAFVDTVGGWRDMYALAGPVALVVGAGMTWLPPSPRWLLLRGMPKQLASDALVRLRRSTPAGVEAELAGMVDAAAATRGGGGGVDFGRLTQRGSLRALYAGISLCLFQQITGQPSVLYYATEIFQKAGFSAAADASRISVGLGVFKLLATGVAVVTVDSLGRRPLLLGGISALTGALLVLSALSAGGSEAWLSVIALLVYVGAYQVSFGPITWLIVGEVFPVEVRSAAVGLATITNFGSNFLVSLVLPSVQDALGPSGTYLAFAFLGVASVASVYFTLPETKGKTLEEIEAEFSGPPSSGARS